VAWRLAGALAQLRREVNEIAPHRSKASDGTIGDPAHASRCSRHNPNGDNVVCAIDLTDDPAGGFDVHAHIELLVGLARMGLGHPDFDYAISKRRYASRATGWQWREYRGSNEHVKHGHIAVGRGSDCEPGPTYDSPQSWGIAATPTPVPGPPDDQEDDDMAKWIYVQAEGSGDIFLASPGLDAYQVTGSFDDADYFVEVSGHVLVTPPGSVDLGQDVKGETRKGLKLKSAEARRWFGLPVR
jgi:hypothetical protein